MQEMICHVRTELRQSLGVKGLNLVVMPSRVFYPSLIVVGHILSFYINNRIICKGSVLRSYTFAMVHFMVYSAFVNDQVLV